MGLNEHKTTFFIIFVLILGLQIFALLKSKVSFPGLEDRVWPFLLISFLLFIISYFSDPRLLRKAAALLKKKPKKIKKRKNISFAKKKKKIDFFNKLYLMFLLQIRKLNDFRAIVNFLFQLFLVVYLILLLINEFVAVKFMNLNYLLVLTIISGVLTVIFPVKKEVEEKPMKSFDKVLIYVLAIIGMILIFIKTKDLGWLSYVISIISGVLIVLVGYLVYEDDEEEELKINFNKKTFLWVIVGLIVLSIILSFFIGLNAFMIVFGSIYVLFLPGFVLSFVFFDKKKIDVLERIALSFALSIAVVPLFVFYLNLIGMKINKLSVSLVILGIIIISYFLYKKRVFKKK